MRFRICLIAFFSAIVFGFTNLAIASQLMLARLEIPNRAQERKLGSIISTLDIAEVKKGEWVKIITDAEEVGRLRGMGFQVIVEQKDLVAYYQSRLHPTKPMGGYHTYSETVDFLDSLHAEHPEITSEKDSIGASVEGRAIWAMKISDNPEVDEDEPEVLYDGLHHAREPITIEVLLYFMSYLVDNYGSLPGVTELVNERELWFIPIVNPDGYLYNEEQDPGGGGMWRKNRSYDSLSDCYGVDPNRNYGYMWGYDDNGSSPYPCDQTYRGPSAFSEPEIQTMRDFTIAHRFVLAMNYHSYSNLFLYPWGYDNIYTPDQGLFTAIADTVVAYTGYTPGTPWELLYNTNGDANDWMYGDTESKPKVFAFTTEVGGEGDGFWPPPYRIEPLCEENLAPNLFIARIADNPWKLLPPEPPVLACLDTVYCDSLELTWQHQDSLNPASSFQLVQKQDYAKITDDLEGGTGNWQPDGFSLSTQRSHSSNHSFYSGEDNYLNVSVTSAERLSVGFNDSLIFWCWYEIEANWDYAYVEVSTDGAEFTPIAGNITTNYNPHGNNRGNGITGSSNGWTLAKFPLEDYVGGQILVRLHYITDTYVTEEGFYFDDFYPVETFGQIDTLVEATSDTFYSITGLEDGTYYYQVRAMDAQFQWSSWSNREAVCVHNVGLLTQGQAEPPLSYGLSQNYPNPFNSSTQFTYSLPKRSRVRIEIYNILGEKVVTLIDGVEEPNFYRVSWDGLNEAGKKMTSGVYFCRIQAGEFSKVRKIIFLR